MLSDADTRSRLSIVTPVFEAVPDEFRLCVSSVFSQTTAQWEWVLVDDGSKEGAHFPVLGELEDHPQIRVIRTPENAGISAATNTAIEFCSGDFVAFLDQDDMLQVNAVERVLDVLLEVPEADIVYSDEDKISAKNSFYSPFRKPDWSPERFRHQNYLNHLTVIRKDLISQVGGLRSEFDGSQDYDLLLRVTERARKVIHIPEVLYHWRAGEGSVAASPEAKPAAHLRAVEAVQQHLRRVGITGKASLMANFYIGVDRQRSKNPLVSIIIPTRGSVNRIGGAETCLVENCVESILDLTDYDNFEIIVVADADSSPESLSYLGGHADARVRTVSFDGVFNFSRKINLGALYARGEILIPLNDDTQVIQRSWIDDLILFLEEPDVGAVAPILLLEDGRIQSAGHFFDDGVHHVAPGFPTRLDGPYGVLSFPAERSGVTFAAVALRRSDFMGVGGLSEEFPRSFNDVDYCNQLLLTGSRIICNAKHALFHFESLTRDPQVESSEVTNLYRSWGSKLSSPDPFLPYFREQMFGS